MRGYGTHETISIIVTSVSSLKLRLEVSVKSKTYLFEVFNMFVILLFFITFIVPVYSYGHGGTVGDQYTLLLCNLDPSSFVSENFVEITFASQSQKY